MPRGVFQPNSVSGSNLIQQVALWVPAELILVVARPDDPAALGHFAAPALDDRVDVVERPAGALGEVEFAQGHAQHHRMAVSVVEPWGDCGSFKSKSFLGP